MVGVDGQFALVFGDTSPLLEESTCMTLYVATVGMVLLHKAPVVPNFDTQGAAMAKEKWDNTPNNIKKVYSPKSLKFRGYYRSLYSSTPKALLITPGKMFGYMYHQAYSDKYLIKRKESFFDRKNYNKAISNMGNDEVGYDLIDSQAI